MLSVYKKLIKYFFTIFSIYENGKYLKHKEKVRKEAHERYQTLSEEEKEIRQKKSPRHISKSFWGRKRKEASVHLECNKNLFEEETEKKVKYMGNYYLADIIYLSWFVYFWGPGAIQKFFCNKKISWYIIFFQNFQNIL